MNYTNKFHTNAITFLGVLTVLVGSAKLGGASGQILFFVGLVFFSLFNGRMRGLRNVDEMVSGTFDVKRAKRVVFGNTCLAVVSVVAVFTVPYGGILGYVFGLSISWCLIDLQSIMMAEGAG
jgi:hypothetical protein